jgi:hypothetical protein
MRYIDDEEHILRTVCRKARGARTRTFRINARGLGVERAGVLRRLLMRLVVKTGVNFIVGVDRRGRRRVSMVKYVVDSQLLLDACARARL